LAQFIHFLPSTQRKIRLGRDWERDDSSGQQSMQNNFQPPWLRKMKIFVFDKAIIQVVTEPCKLLYCLLTTEIST
jgi:hypothetical protein